MGEKGGPGAVAAGAVGVGAAGAAAAATAAGDPPFSYFLSVLLSFLSL